MEDEDLDELLFREDFEKIIGAVLTKFRIFISRTMNSFDTL